MKSFKSYITEGTESASVQEAAICIAYNMMRNKLSYDDAAAQAGISKAILPKITKDMMEIGKKVAKQAGNLGPYLDHSGRGAAGVNHYAVTLKTGASDTTPKTDFIGDIQHAISLKKSGDAGSKGAQLMSAKSGEASGVVQAAIKHFQNNKGNIADDKQMQKVLNILGKEMKKTARNDINVIVGEGKENFESWYTKKSSRRDELVGLGHKPADVEKHLKSELSILRVTKTDKYAESRLIKGVRTISKTQMKDFFDEYIEDQKAKVVKGKGLNKAEYLKGVPAEQLTQEALKTQVVEILETSMKTQGWQTELENFFNDNEEFKQYLVYEASSGMFKFTGQPVGRGNYKGSETAVAKQILVFNNSGIKDYYTDIFKWSKANTHLANNISIAYKGSGRSRYIKMAIMAGKVYDEQLPSLMEELDQYEKEYLTEGILGNIGKAVVNAVSNFAKAMVNFAMRLVEGVITRMKNLLTSGLDVFMNTLGIEASGGYVNTSW